ncbi:hypothetical protein J1N35_000827 [Gossypium stocksii]|uniref:Uncharacterized protein n=1 Tax=Gossypium stocksii TaxID=47602 RepID=A0A9D3WIU0_9ROSI|nr:hypothetical protein J1N35_000827 [Gossypium stocksii]
MPSTHNTTVSKEMMLLLHSIIKQRTINVRAIICQEVYRCDEKNAGSLNFLSLIIAICMTANVPFTDDEDITPNKGGLIRVIFAKLRGSVSEALTLPHADVRQAVEETEKSTSIEPWKDKEEGKE